MANTMNTLSSDAENFFIDALPGQERYVAPEEETPLRAVDSIDESAPPTSMWADAWRTLRKNPLFIISAILIVFIVVVALFPQLFTSNDPKYCTLDNSLAGPSAGHPLGFDKQGCDVYSRVVYGARTSISVGILTTLIVALVGGLIGAIAGFFGGWVDAILSRITDIFYAIPMLLGAIVVLQMFRTSTSIWKVVLVLALFGWVSIARIARSAVLEAKNLEFNTASTALGSTPMRNLFRHVIPNSLAPVIVIGDHVPRFLHRLRGHVELPRHRSAVERGQLGWRHLDRAVPAADQSGGAVLSVGGAGGYRARVHHDGRRGEGRP